MRGEIGKEGAHRGAQVSERVRQPPVGRLVGQQPHLNRQLGRWEKDAMKRITGGEDRGARLAVAGG